MPVNPTRLLPRMSGIEAQIGIGIEDARLGKPGLARWPRVMAKLSGCFGCVARSAPIAEIKSMVTKTVGMHDVLHAALDPLGKKINGHRRE